MRAIKAETMNETTQQDEDSILEWVWVAVQGDFNEDPTAGQIITNAVITAIPVVDQVADARDLAASVKALLWDKRHDDFEVWLAFFFTLIGLVPSVGSLLKGVLKLVWKGAKLDAILRVFNAFAKGNGVAWLKQLRAGGLREYSKQAAELGKKVLDNVTATLKEAMEYIPSWAGGIYQRMSDLLAELAIIRSKIEDVFNKITLGMEEKLDDLLKEKKINSAQGSSKSTLMVRQEADEVPPRTHQHNDDLVKVKRVQPSSLSEAAEILKKRREEIALNGYKPKYDDELLSHMASYSDVGNERFQVRFMESRYLQNRETPEILLSGAMGQTMEGATGKGAKYWSTSFDQLEDADSDPKLISEKLGLQYQSDREFSLVIVDSEKAAPLTGVKSVSATFEELGKFSNKELPDDFPKEFTDVAMTPEFQSNYAEHFAAAVEQSYLKDEWSRDTVKFNKYLQSTGISQKEIDLMMLRMEMAGKVGNNQYYLGNGLTKDMNPSTVNDFGVVETLNFERKEVNLKQLSDANAITILKLSPI